MAEQQMNNNIENLELFLSQSNSNQGEKSLKVLRDMGENSCLIKLLKFNEFELNVTIQIPGKNLIIDLKIFILCIFCFVL
jgi:hypothetical protein